VNKLILQKGKRGRKTNTESITRSGSVEENNEVKEEIWGINSSSSSAPAKLGSQEGGLKKGGVSYAEEKYG